MDGKFDLARMLSEIREENKTRSDANRALTQDEIRQMVAERNKQTVVKSATSDGNS